MEEALKFSFYDSPVGRMVLGSFADRLCLCDWADGKRHAENARRVSRFLHAHFEEADSEINIRTAALLDKYFAKELTRFETRLLFTGSEFQCRVWSELVKIPFGETVTYAELAFRIGNPKAVRAVASACASNPISIIVPCHRVIGSNHNLTGYAGGIHVKRILLEHENHLLLPGV